MKIFPPLILGFSLLVFCVFPAYAETFYVGDRVEANVRRGKGTDFRISSIVRVGTAVEVLEKDGGWTKVRLPNGKQGWMLSRYLTAKQPSGRALAKLEKEQEALLADLALLKTENQSFKQENTELALALEKQARVSEKLDREHSALLEDSKGLFSLKKSMKTAKRELVLARKKADQAQTELETLRTSTGVKWFLAGAGVLLFGFILGRILAPRRQRSSLLR